MRGASRSSTNSSSSRLRARLLQALGRRQAEQHQQEQEAGNALQFQAIVVVVDKASGAIDHQLCADATVQRT